MAEQRAFNPLVEGSSPSRPTTRRPGLAGPADARLRLRLPGRRRGGGSVRGRGSAPDRRNALAARIARSASTRIRSVEMAASSPAVHFERVKPADRAPRERGPGSHRRDRGGADGRRAETRRRATARGAVLPGRLLVDRAEAGRVADPAFHRGDVHRHGASSLRGDARERDGCRRSKSVTASESALEFRKLSRLCHAQDSSAGHSQGGQRVQRAEDCRRTRRSRVWHPIERRTRAFDKTLRLSPSFDLDATCAAALQPGPGNPP